MYKRIIPVIIGALVCIALAYFLNALIIPLTAMILGFFLVGVALTPVVDKATGYGNTIFFPLIFIVISLVALYANFGGNTLKVLTIDTWCGITPCTPILGLLAAFLIGFAAFIAGEYWSGKKVQLLGKLI